MEDWALLCVVAAALLLALLASLLAVALYSGLFAAAVARTGPPPVRGLVVAYKYGVGPYRQSGRVFTEAASIGPRLRSIGVYYDNPALVSPDKTRYAVGSILAEGEEVPSEDLCKLYEKFGFRIISFPEVTHVVKTTFPYTTFLSIYLALHRLGPVLGNYIKERKLCAHPWVEIYWDDVIHYFCPLAKQVQFYVPEVQDAARQQREETSHASDEAAGDTSSEASSFTHDSGSVTTRDSVSTVMQDSESQAVSAQDLESEGGDRKEHRDEEEEDGVEEAGRLAAVAAAALAASIGAAGKAERDVDGDNSSDRSESGASGSSFEEITGGEDEGDKAKVAQLDPAREPAEMPEVQAEL